MDFRKEYLQPDQFILNERNERKLLRHEWRYELISRCKEAAAYMAFVTLTIAMYDMASDGDLDTPGYVAQMLNHSDQDSSIIAKDPSR